MLSLFSPQALSWIRDKSGEDDIEEKILPQHLNNGRWMSWKEDVFSDIFHRRVFTPLPPKEEAISMLERFFEAFNPLFPLFHQPTFMRLVERQYSGHSHNGSGWWASLNVALALAYMLRKMNNSHHNDDEQKAWSFMKNALGVLSELTVRKTDLQSVQALLGMAHFMQTTSNPQLSLPLYSAAIRVSHSIGLHRENLLLNLSPVESEVQKRVFWVGYILDQDTSLRSGRPAAQDDSDMDMSLPDETPSDGVGYISLSSGTGKCNIFRSTANLLLSKAKFTKCSTPSKPPHIPARRLETLQLS
jgi:Fungal specific transcription factor domain